MLKTLMVMAFLISPSEMQTVGKGDLQWMFWTAYEAELRAPNGVYDASKPFALKLTYNMDFTGKQIAERSIEEMRNQGFSNQEKLASWNKKLTEIFPDIKEGDSITGINSADGNSVFLHNDKKIGSMKDAEFTKAFFDIWLSEKTSEPKLRKKLLAGN